MSARREGLLCAGGVVLIWASFLLAARLAAAQPLTAWDVAALRHAGAFLAALPLLGLRGPPRLPPLRAPALTAAAAFGFPLCAYWAFRFAPAAHGAVLRPGLLPFLAAVVWWRCFGEPWTGRRSLSLAIVAGGMALLAADTFGEHPGAWRGDLLFAVGCAAWVGYMAMVRRWGVSALDATLAIALLAAPLYLPFWWWALPSNMAEAPAGWIGFHLVQQGVLSVVLAGSLLTRAQLLLGGPQTSAVTSLVPARVALGAWPLLGEALGLAGLLGVGLVTLGMVTAVGGAAPRPR